MKQTLENVWKMLVLAKTDWENTKAKIFQLERKLTELEEKSEKMVRLEQVILRSAHTHNKPIDLVPEPELNIPEEEKK